MSTATRGRQLNRPAPMVATLEHVAGSQTVVLELEHGVAQSWSRAVDPGATRRMMDAMRAGTVPAVQWTLTATDYGHTMIGDDRCVSRYTYTRQARA